MSNWQSFDEPFFFDVETKAEVYQDFRGYKIVKLEEAQQLAEL